jgi:hypothetical protein
MRCAKYHRLIGDLLDGTIRAGDRNRLEAHLRTCTECRELSRDFERITAEAKSLPQEDPSEDVWNSVRAKIGESRIGGRLRGEGRGVRRVPSLAHPGLRWAWAAGFLFAGAVIGLVIGLHPWKTEAPSAWVLDQRQTVAKLEEAETHYRLAIQAMTEAMGGGRGGLDPAMADMFKGDLKIVDTAIESCRAALTKDPADLDARIYLLGAYQKKVEVLNGLIELRKKAQSGPAAGAGL